MIAQLGLRNLSRRRARAAIVAGTLVLGVSVAIVGLSVVNSMEQNYRSLVIGTMAGDIAILPPEAPAGSPPLDGVAGLAARAAAIPGVAYASPRVSAPGVLVAGENSSPVVVVGVNAAVEQRLAGSFSDPDRPFALGEGASLAVGKNLAADLALAEGDEVVLAAVSPAGRRNTLALTVSRVFSGQAQNPAIDQWVLVNLDTARALLDLGPDEAGEVKVFLAAAGAGADEAVAGEALARVRDLAPAGARVQEWTASDAAGWLVAPRAWKAVMLFFVAVLFLLIAVGASSVVVTSVMERVREVGTLKALGMSPGQLAGMLLFETLCMIVAGCAGGAALGGAGTLALRAARIEAMNDSLAITFGGRYLSPILAWGDVVGVAVFAALVCMAAVFLPVRRVARMRVTEALRHV